MSFLRTRVFRSVFITSQRRLTSSAHPTTYSLVPLLWGSAFVVSASIALTRPTIHLDASIPTDFKVDPATQIEFPTTLTVPSRTSLPTFSLIGLGVRTVSFLGVKVYSVGFYADLSNSRLNISRSASAEEKIKHIVQNTACVIRIVPTRSTSYSHLRDGFMRALVGRMKLSHSRGTITQEEEDGAQSPLRVLKSIFPNTPLAKHTPLEVMLTAPDPTRPRSLVIRDMGAIENDWVATEFVLAYFEGPGISPALKESAVSHLTEFGN